MIRIVMAAAVLLLGLGAGPAAAACPPGAMTPPGQVRLPGEAVMIVTHATSVHDARLATKRGVDEAVRLARGAGIPVVYLQDDGPPESYFADECAPDYRVASGGGEIAFDVQPAHLYAVGGHLEMCLSASLHDVLLVWSRRPPRDLTVTLLMDAIYSNGKLIDESDPYHRDFERFMDVVSFGRPGGEHWPKVTLLETLGVIADLDRQLDYLTRVLPHWERTFDRGYRVELQYGEHLRVLQRGRGVAPPRLRFRFVESALDEASLNGRLPAP